MSFLFATFPTDNADTAKTTRDIHVYLSLFIFLMDRNYRKKFKVLKPWLKTVILSAGSKTLSSEYKNLNVIFFLYNSQHY